MEKEFAVILNFETGRVESLVLEDRGEMDADEYIETVLDYNLSNCQWMVVKGEPGIEPLNY